MPDTPQQKSETPAARDAETAPLELPGQLVWTVSPWRANWRRPAGALAACLAIALLAGFSFTYPNYPAGAAPVTGVPWWYQALGWSGLAFLFLAGMTAVLYLPIRYRLDARGVTVYFMGAPSYRPWSHYRNFYVHPSVVHLTTMPTPSPLDPFRGHPLQFAGNRELVVAFIRAHMTEPSEGEAPSPGTA